MVDLPPAHLAVLRALMQPDPRPPVMFDSAGAAVQRRIPELGTDQAEQILRELNEVGLTDIPNVDEMVSPAATLDLRKWITEEGRKVLGLVTETDGRR